MLTDKNVVAKEKSEEIDKKVIKILEDREKDFVQLTENLEKLEEVQRAIQKIMNSFSDLGIKKLVTDASAKITSEIEEFKKIKEDVDELLSHLDKMAEVDVIVGALEIIAKDTKDSGLAKNLENLIFYIRENGTGNDSITLLSRASWKW